MRHASTRGAVDLPKLVVGSIMILLLMAVLSWLQSRFDTSDHKKAEALVQRYTAAPDGPSITTLILKRHPGVEADQISWSSEIMQSCYGYVRVSAYVPAKEGRAAETYAFDVSLSDPSLHPTDERTVEIMKALSSTTAR